MVTRPAGSAEVPPPELVVAGKVTTVHGVKGWVKIHSFTEPESNLFDYQPWWMKLPDGWKKIEVDQYRAVTRGFIAHIAGLDDRDEARLYCQREIRVSPDAFPPAGEGETYWHDLLGLEVVTRIDEAFSLLGTVADFMETVMVVRPSPASIDRQERLLPYTGDCVLDVDLAAGRILVDWDPAFESGDG